jgi:hypothetical protein
LGRVPRKTLQRERPLTDNREKAACAAFVERSDRLRIQVNPWEKYMAGQVVLYFDDQADALRFALAAGSVMAGSDGDANGDLVLETTRVTRIRLDAVNAGKIRKGSPPERAA